MVGVCAVKTGCAGSNEAAPKSPGPRCAGAGRVRRLFEAERFGKRPPTPSEAAAESDALGDERGLIAIWLEFALAGERVITPSEAETELDLCDDANGRSAISLEAARLYMREPRPHGESFPCSIPSRPCAEDGLTAGSADV